jgi:hypothetical protein
MIRRDRRTPALRVRLTLPTLATIVVLIGGTATGLLAARDSTPAATVRNLEAAGITTYAGLILQPVDAPPAPSVIPFKTGARQGITEAGYRILINVGDQDSDLAGGFAERTYKVPNPMYIIP